jgi:hypothetical protein
VLNLACDLGTLGDQPCQNVWFSHAHSTIAGINRVFAPLSALIRSTPH